MRKESVAGHMVAAIPDNAAYSFVELRALSRFANGDSEAVYMRHARALSSSVGRRRPLEKVSRSATMLEMLSYSFLHPVSSSGRV